MHIILNAEFTSSGKECVFVFLRWWQVQGEDLISVFLFLGKNCDFSNRCGKVPELPTVASNFVNTILFGMLDYLVVDCCLYQGSVR